MPVGTNIISSALVKFGSCRLTAIDIIVAGSADGTVNDCATTGAAAIGNQVAVASHVQGVGTYLQNKPIFTGLVVIPGTGQTLTVTYEELISP